MRGSSRFCLRPYFLHYIIDMNDSIKSGHYIFFADDTTVFNNSFKSCINMNEDQKFLHKWSEKNYLTLNRSKCVKTQFGKKKSQLL